MIIGQPYYSPTIGTIIAPPWEFKITEITMDVMFIFTLYELFLFITDVLLEDQGLP